MTANIEMTLEFNGRLAIFASGSGSNAEALMKKASELENVQVTCLVTDKEDAGVISKAKNFNVSVEVVPVSKEIKDINERRLEHEKRVIDALRKYDFEYIFLAGYMRMFSSSFLEKYKITDFGNLSRIINIHPSLLPSFKGVRAYDDAFEANVKISGCTLHFIDENMDEGVIIDQRSFERKEDDDLSIFKKRGLGHEHEMYTSFLEKLAKNKVKLFKNNKGTTCWLDN